MTTHVLDLVPIMWVIRLVREAKPPTRPINKNTANKYPLNAS